MAIKDKLTYFNSFTNMILLAILLIGGSIWAETNGVWHHAEDIAGGVMAQDQQAQTNNFTFINPVFFLGDFIGSKAYCDENGSDCFNASDVGIGTILEVYTGTCKNQDDGFMFLTNESNELRMCIGGNAFSFDMTQVADIESELTAGGTYYNINIYEELGSPTEAGLYGFTIPSGTMVGSKSTSQPALITGNFPANSTLIIINRGTIAGRGGDGGRGSNGYWYGCTSHGTGGVGGHALELNMDVILDNTVGSIWGGGRGGNGGPSCPIPGWTGVRTGSGGGGGGAGLDGGSGGSGGCNSYGGCGYAGGAGSLTAGGGAGAGGPGNPGNGGTDRGNPGTPGGGLGDGQAIRTNGNSIDWRGGNAAPQIQGAVS